MAHYLIFLPNEKSSNPRKLEDVGLGALFRDDEPGPEMVDCVKGPTGGPGALLTWRDHTGESPTVTKLHMHDDLEWKEAVEIEHPELGTLPKGRFWIGVDKKNPVQPRDLIRRNPINGVTVMLADGYSWMVPTISRFPNRYQLNDGGEVARVCKDEYQEFYAVGMRVVAQMMEQFSQIEDVRDKIEGIEDYSIEVTAKDGLVLISKAISINYRLTWEIGFMLDLFDEESSARALIAFCELTLIKTALDQKKTLDPILIRVGSYSLSGSPA